MISHEIRTPLNAACLGLEVVREELTKHGASFLLETIECVRMSCESAVDLVSDVLTHDKMEDDKLVVERAPLSVWTMVKRSVKPFTLQAKQANVTLSLVDDEERLSTWLINGDNNKLTQIMRNLISNALKFSPKRTTVTIKLSLETETDEEGELYWIRIDVVDMGAGISKVKYGI